MKLVIAEKKELGQNIAHAICGAPEGCRLPFEGNGYRVVNCIGHLLELREPADIDAERWGDRRDLSVLPILAQPWPKAPQKGKEEALKAIKKGLSECAAVIHAGDPDDEGQLLVDEVLDYFGYTGPVQRVYINDNLTKNIVKAFGRLKDNRECRRDGEAALARSIADFCFGVNESRLIAIKAGGAHLSVGRVKTPTLGLVVRRDEEIMGHHAREYYTGTAQVEIDGVVYGFAFKPNESMLDPDLKKCCDRAAMERALSAARGVRGTVETVVERKAYKAPLPYNLVDLMADMGRRYKLGTKAVQDATQTLRDKYRAITYNRSDCNYLPVEAHSDAPAVLGAAMSNIGVSWDLDYSIRGRCFNDANITAHTGIIPQETRVDVSGMSDVERKIYTAIIERYAMQFMPDAQADISSTSIEVEGGALEHKAKRPVTDGWKAIVMGGKDEDDRDMMEGFIEAGTHSYAVGEGKVEAKKTKPRPPYTEASLAKDMSSIAKYVSDPEIKRVLIEKDKGKKGEHGGIGTPATRASTIESLKKSGYLEVVKGRLVSTNLGRQVYHACPEDIRSADLTARWWLMCEEVRAGHADPYSVAQSVCREFMRHRDTAYQNVTISKSANAAVVGTCPRCGKPVVDRGPKALKVSCSSNTGRWEETDGKKAWIATGGCGFEMWKTVAGKKLTDKQLGQLLDRGRTDVISGFKSKKGGTFKARLVMLDAQAGKIGFEFPERK